MMWVAIAAVAMQAMNQMQQGQQQAMQYQAQATQTRLQGRAQAVQYEQQANNVLKRSMQAQAMARARAAAGGLDPFSGSAQFVQNLSAKESGEDLSILADNAELARQGSGFQATLYESAARRARSSGLMSGFSTIGLGAARAYGVGGAYQQ
jgi:type I site-specific restriction endonuclease